MSRRRKPEQIINLPREAEIALSLGKTISQVYRTLACPSRAIIGGARNMAGSERTRPSG
jgi:hypothetical protein